MVAAGFAANASVAARYDADSFLRAMTETRTGWPVRLQAEPLIPGEAEGVLLGGCLTLVEATLGTSWELDTAGSILLLERPVAHVRFWFSQASGLLSVEPLILVQFRRFPVGFVPAAVCRFSAVWGRRPQRWRRRHTLLE